VIARAIASELKRSASESPVVTVLGPRQSGKTTAVRAVFPEHAYRNLEEPDTRALAMGDPRGFLAGTGSACVLDEIQRCPELLSYVQSEVDSKPGPGRFVLTGSHQPELHQAVSQSLAGRTAVLTLLPFAIDELRGYRPAWSPWELITSGSFPRVHEERVRPDRFFNGYVQTYLERDVRALVNLRDLRRFQQFLTLLAGRVAQIVSYTALSNDVGVSSTTIKSWIAVLQASFVVFELPPYFENVRKRVVRSPKLYFTDTGLAAYLLGIRTAEQAERDPLRGALYENLVVTELLKQRLNRGLRPDMYFFRDSHGNEVDVVLRDGRQLIPIEIKSAATFDATFLRGLASFRDTVGEPAATGAVLYNGDRELVFHGTRVLNPLRHEAFATLAAPESD
jgi:hypothetical protein